MSKRERLPTSTRQEVKHSQGCLCGMCAKKFQENELYIHHIKPVSFHSDMEKKNRIQDRRTNLVALCDPCHQEADRLVFQENIYFTDIFNRKEVGEIVVFERLPIDYNKFTSVEVGASKPHP